MPTTNKGFEQPTAGSTNWNVPLNANFGYIDSALGSTASISVTGVTATPVVLLEAQYRNLILSFTGTLTANVTYQVPAGVGGEWIVQNNTTGSFTLTIGNVSAGASAVVPTGARRLVYSDGTNVYAVEGTSTGSVTSVDVSGGTTGLTTSGGPITSSGTITLGGTLALANGGTGATSAAGALANIVGFTPVQQGGGSGMLSSKVRIGWGTASNLLAQVDATPVGDLVRRVDAYSIGGNSELIAPGAPPLYAARAWVNFYGGTGGIRRSGNVSSITRFGTGSYTVNFSIAMSDANYSGCAMFYSPSTSTYPYAPVYNGMSAGGFAFQCITASVGLFDPDIVNFVAFS